MSLYCYCTQHSKIYIKQKMHTKHICYLQVYTLYIQTIKTSAPLYHIKNILWYIGRSQIIIEYKHEHHNKQNKVKNKNKNEPIMFRFLLVVFVLWLVLFYNHQACKANIWCHKRHKILISLLYDVLMLLLSLVVMMLILMQYSVMHNK